MWGHIFLRGIAATICTTLPSWHENSPNWGGGGLLFFHSLHGFEGDELISFGLIFHSLVHPTIAH